MMPSFRLHKVADQPPDLPVPHVEYIAKDQVQKSAILFGRSHGTLRHHYIVFLRQPAHGNQRVADKSLIDDVLDEVVLASDMKCTRNHPLNVISQAGQNLRTIRSPETIHIGFNRSLVQCHGNPRTCVWRRLTIGMSRALQRVGSMPWLSVTAARSLRNGHAPSESAGPHRR